MIHQEKNKFMTVHEKINLYREKLDEALKHIILLEENPDHANTVEFFIAKEEISNLLSQDDTEEICEVLEIENDLDDVQEPDHKSTQETDPFLKALEIVKEAYIAQKIKKIVNIEETPENQKYWEKALVEMANSLTEKIEILIKSKEESKKS